MAIIKTAKRRTRHRCVDMFRPTPDGRRPPAQPAPATVVNGAQRQPIQPQDGAASEATGAPICTLKLDLSLLDHHDRVAPIGGIVAPAMFGRQDDHASLALWREMPMEYG